MSPNYPNDYPNGVDQTYPLQGHGGQILNITFMDVDIEGGNSSCEFDWVQVNIKLGHPPIFFKVFDGDGTTLLEKTCGSNKPLTLTSVTNRCVY